MSKPLTLTEEDFAWAAQELACKVPAIKAVCEVEAPRGGFLSNGKLVILFERHKFHKYSKGRYSIGANAEFSWPKAGGYCSGKTFDERGEKEWERFKKAFALDPQAAQLSASYGKFQIMGFNFAVCGYASVEEMIAAFQTGERAQLEGFVEFVQQNGLQDELQRLDWAGFARGYNGADYKINSYDVKLAKAFAKYQA